ncbi:hypothetical protein [Thiohalorhabdus sp.]|uniref:hypothetical protein n=1 Tax=Thiohalorhabdus sp. TaxID=3094134 RepID=UPI002FC3640A
MSDGPTINRRLQPGFIIVTTDESLVRELQGVAGDDWEVLAVAAIEDAGEWNEILLYRFILLDLDSCAGDPAEQVRSLRQESMVNTPVIGVGGTKEEANRVRPQGADRFFARDEIADTLPDFLAALGWGKGG